MTINNREIKFNAYDPEGIFTDDNKPGMLYDITGLAIFDHIWHEDEFIKVQYTGRKDRNGKEIYDKDIFYNHDRDCNQLVRWDDIRIATPTIPNINSHNEGPMYLDLINRFSIEVIGNVFQNSELIDTQQKND